MDLSFCCVLDMCVFVCLVGRKDAGEMQVN
jgi:hypothetical protein